MVVKREREGGKKGGTVARGKGGRQGGKEEPCTFSIPRPTFLRPCMTPLLTSCHFMHYYLTISFFLLRAPHLLS